MLLADLLPSTAVVLVVGSEAVAHARPHDAQGSGGEPGAISLNGITPFVDNVISQGIAPVAHEVDPPSVKMSIDHSL